MHGARARVGQAGDGAGVKGENTAQTAQALEGLRQADACMHEGRNSRTGQGRSQCGHWHNGRRSRRSRSACTGIKGRAGTARMLRRQEQCRQPRRSTGWAGPWETDSPKATAKTEGERVATCAPIRRVIHRDAVNLALNETALSRGYQGVKAKLYIEKRLLPTACSSCLAGLLA